MPQVKVQGPNGATYTVNAPEGASDDDILAYAQAHFGQESAQSAPAAGASSLLDQAHAAQTAGGAMTPAQQQAIMDETEPKAKAAQDVKSVGAGLLRSPLNFAEGAGQLMTGAASKLGIPGAAAYYDRYNDAVNDMRSEADKKNPGSVLTGDIAAGLIPIGRYGSAVEKGGKYLATLAKTGIAGATLGGTQFAEDGQKGLQIGLSAAFPMATQAVASILPTFKNQIARVMERANQSRTASFREAAANFVKENDLPAYSAGQQTGSPAVQRLEARAAGKYAQEFYATQSDKALGAFENMADNAEALAKARATPGTVATGINEAIRSQSNKMRAIRNAEYDKGINQFTSLAQADGKVFVPTLAHEFEAIMAEDSNKYNILKGILPESIKEVAGIVGKPVPLADMGQVLKGLNKGKDYSGAIFKDASEAELDMYRGRLRTALQNDLDHLDTTTLSPSGQAAMSVLKDTQDQYAQRSDRLRRLDNDSVNKIFGDAESLTTPQAALNRFYALNPRDQDYAVELLSTTSPDVLQAMRSHKLREAIDASTIRDAAAQSSKFDPSKFLQEINAGVNERNKSKLFGPGMQKQLDEGASHLAVILNAPGSKGGTTIWPEEVAINLVSRSPEFVARAVTRMVYGTQGDKLLFTPQGLSALRTLSNTGNKSAQQTTQALAWVMSSIEDEERKNKQQDQQQQQNPQ